MLSQWVCFSLGDEKYAHRIESIGEILPYSEPTRVPDAPKEVEGVLNVRGEIVTILSGRTLLKPSQPQASRQILTLTTCCGVSVDHVEEIISLDDNEIDPPQCTSANLLIKGTTKHRDKLLILVDFLPCCNDDRTANE